MSETLLRDDRQGSRNESTRQHNLSLVLTSVHARGPLTRAELTRQTGLNRSTIGALVTELAQLGLAYETPAANPRTVGRPSPLVHASPDVVALGVNPDIGAVQLAVVGLGGVVHSIQTGQTEGPPSPEHSVDVLRELVAECEAIHGRLVVGVGLAVPGLVNEYDQRVRIAPHLGWENVDYAAMVSDALGYPTAAANDANLGVVAEAIFGAGRGCDNVVYLNGSTSGIGGGVIVDGRLLRGARSFGAELGHTLVNSDGERCSCGRTGCLETEVTLQRIWAVAGDNRIGLDALDAFYASHHTGPIARELDRQAAALAVGIANMVTVFSPERVIVGGHVGALYDARKDVIDAEVNRLSLPELAEGLSVVRNALRERMMPMGAAELAFGPLLADPAGVSETLSGSSGGRRWG